MVEGQDAVVLEWVREGLKSLYGVGGRTDRIAQPLAATAWRLFGTKLSADSAFFDFQPKFDAVAEYFEKDHVPRETWLGVFERHPRLFTQAPSTLIANSEGAWRIASAMPLSRPAFIRILLRNPKLLTQRPDRLDSNIRSVATALSPDGVSERDYLKACGRQPRLWTHSPTTILRNVDESVRLLADAGVDRQRYLTAALRLPQLFTSNPVTIHGNVDQLVRELGGGLQLKQQLVGAALRRAPQLLVQRPRRLLDNIQGLATAFASEDLQLQQVVTSALRQPAIFTLSPARSAGNITAVVDHFAEHGLTRPAYLNSALSLPALFCSKPATIIGHVEAIAALIDADLLVLPPAKSGPDTPVARVLQLCRSSPAVFVLSMRSIQLRAKLAETGTAPRSAALLKISLREVEARLAEWNDSGNKVDGPAD